MGCCFSRSSGPNSPYPGGGPNSSARAINPPPLSLATDSIQPAPQPSSPRHRRRRDQGPLDQQINRPLRRHEWTSDDRRWTRRELDRERADFFDTRVSGRPEAWQAIHAALQALWEDQLAHPGTDADALGTEHDDAISGLEGLRTAQTILSAAEISLPTGNLANGAYDPLGSYYQLPEWVVSDPADLADDAKARDEDMNEADMDDAASDDAERRREEKGKAVVDVREQVTLRARLSESGRDYQVYVGKSENVSSIARKIATESGLASTKRIRIAYMGKILKENSPLEPQGWHAGHVVNALVFNR